MYVQEDFDQKVGWFGGLFAASGSLYITRWGTMASGRERLTLGATFSVHLSRKELIDDVISIFNIGRLVEKRHTFYNKAVWEATTLKEVEVVLELLEQVVWPLPTLLMQQMVVARKFLDLRPPSGKSSDPGLSEDVYLYRTKLRKEMQALTEWKKSLEYKEDLNAGVKRIERAARRKKRAGDPQL